MLQDISYDKYVTQVNQKLSTGGTFLTVKSDKVNTMTIGWGSIGYMWGKPVFMVPVRKSRFTHELIEKSNEFTVSIPFEGLKKELALCGSKSGRNIDKFKELGLTTIDGKVIDTPVIDGCDLHYECKVIFKQEMDSENLDSSCKDRWYGDGNYHTLYFGEIIACYGKEEEYKVVITLGGERNRSVRPLPNILLPKHFLYIQSLDVSSLLYVAFLTFQ